MTVQRTPSVANRRHLSFAFSGQPTFHLTSGLREAARLLAGHGGREVARLAAADAGAAVLRLATTALAARILGPDEFGVAALAMAFPSLIGSLLSLKSVTVAIPFFAELREKQQYRELGATVKLVYLADLVLAILMIAAVAGSGWVVAGHLFGRPEIYLLMVVYVAFFPLTVTGAHRGVLVCYGRFSWIAWLTLGQAIASFVLVTLLALMSLGSWSMVFGLAGSSAMAGVSMVGAASYLLARESKVLWWKSPLRLSYPWVRPIVKFSGWHYVTVTLEGVVHQAPVMMLGWVKGAAEAGYYRLALGIVGGINMLGSGAHTVAYERLGRAVASSVRMAAIRRRVVRWTVLAGPVSLGLAGVSVLLVPIVVERVFGAGYRPMVLGTQVLVAAEAIGLALFWVGAFYYAMRNARGWAIAYLLFTGMLLASGWVGSVYGGFTGVAVTVGIVTVLWRVCVAIMTITSKSLTGGGSSSLQVR